MCGLTGFAYSSKYSYDNENLLNNMLEKIAHRGLDHRGTYFKSTNNYNIGLGHNRLSIIDTSDRANQPYHFQNYSIVFNGEIYNYKELWEILIKHGYTIDTSSDTEVILKLFHLHKEHAFSFLNGMFAVVIHDNYNNKLYMARDRMGVKPLVYYIDNEHLYFSSEIKSIYKDIPKNKIISINKELLNNYFKFGFINSFDSIFDNIKKVKNGQIVSICLINFTINESFYWELNKIIGEKIDDIEVAYQELIKVVDSSVKYRLVSDVGFGIFLSSGIDSNLVMNVILSGCSPDSPKYINSYTYQGLNSLGNEEAVVYDDSIVKQNNVQLSDDDLWSDYKYLCLHYDEPFSDPATIALYGLSRKARDHNKVILVGDGGDELLGGYNSYEQLYYYTRPNFKWDILKKIYKPFAFIMNWVFQNFPFFRYLDKIHLFHSILSNNSLLGVLSQLENRFVPVIEKITSLKFNVQAPINEDKNNVLSFLNYKIQTELIHQLNYKTDIAGMLQTIEIREPLLDYRLFELQQRFTDNIFYDKSKKINGKYLYRRILSSYNKNLSGLKKKGFRVDMDKVFKANSKEIDKFIVNHKSDYVNLDYINQLWTNYKSGKVDFILMNRILSFLYWESNLKNRI